MSNNFTFVNQTPEQIASGEQPTRVYSSGAKSKAQRIDYNRLSRAQNIGMQDIRTPDETVPLKPAARPLLLPSQFGTMLHPDHAYPPIFLPSKYSLENFGTFLDAVCWAGIEYGAVHLRLEEKEDIETVWQRNKDGTIRSALSHRFETRQQYLRPYYSESGDHRVQAFQMEWTALKKTDQRTRFDNWAQKLGKTEDWDQHHELELWEAEIKLAEKAARSGKIYGIDTPVSLFHRHNSPLRVFEQNFNILNLNPTKFDGLHEPYVYGGTPGTVFCWHVEDYHTYSANYHISGANKVWYTIPPYYIKNFVQKIKGILKFEENEDTPTSCYQFLRHQFVVNPEQYLPLEPAAWKQEGFKCYKYVQQEGDMIITWPGVYHSGINTGWNLNEAVNFGTRNWLEEAKHYRPCNCKLQGGSGGAIEFDLVEIEKRMM